MPFRSSDILGGLRSAFAACRAPRQARCIFLAELNERSNLGKGPGHGSSLCEEEGVVQWLYNYCLTDCGIWSNHLSLTQSDTEGGRPRLADRACLTGIIFVLRGIPWEMLPQGMGCGSGMSCWRRLRDWQEAGVWQLIHFVLLDWLARKGQIDWSLAVVYGSSIRAVFGCNRLV
jgi:transposase